MVYNTIKQIKRKTNKNWKDEQFKLEPRNILEMFSNSFDCLIFRIIARKLRRRLIYNPLGFNISQNNILKMRKMGHLIH